jgi:hypothetical protein
MFRAQKGRCRICGGLPDATGRLCVDHNHATGKVRGLLCRLCNAGLGAFRDNVKCVAEALKYLKGTG